MFFLPQFIPYLYHLPTYQTLCSSSLYFTQKPKMPKVRNPRNTKISAKLKVKTNKQRNKNNKTVKRE